MTSVRRPYLKGMMKWVDVAGVAIIVLVLVTIVLRPDPKHQVTSNRDTCASNLKAIGTALRLYADAHGDHYPDSLEELVLSGATVTKDRFFCPSSNDDIIRGNTASEIAASFASTDPRYLSYIYLGRGATHSNSTNVPLVCDRLENHNHVGVTILWSGGDVQFTSADEAKKLLGDQILD